MMKGRDLDLYSLNTIATDKANLSVLLPLLTGLAKLQANQPLDLRLDLRVRGIDVNIRDVQAP